MIFDTLALCMVFVWYRTDTILHTHDVPTASYLACLPLSHSMSRPWKRVWRQFCLSDNFVPHLCTSLYVSIVYRLWILNLILFNSPKSHVYVRVTVDTFFLLPSFDENLHCSCPWYQSLVESNDLILIR